MTTERNRTMTVAELMPKLQRSWRLTEKSTRGNQSV
ncbi:MAG: hypothetical protein CM15mP18_1340 [Methanobacteriota archaeon]|nr:MAG: hypothetical protein CM15mP18_1340 [Euryarchaeota archaeon]